MRLAAAFPRDRVPESTIQLYADKLAEKNGPDLIAVIEQAMEHYKKFPTIAELREDWNAARRYQYIEPIAAISRGDMKEPVYVPMPNSIKKQLSELDGKMRERSEELT